jgi:hypothetical protein
VNEYAETETLRASFNNALQENVLNMTASGGFT